MPVGIVPVERLEALSAVIEEPEPARDVAATDPVTVTPELFTVTTSPVVAPLLPTPKRTVPSGLAG
jgi:hypothetical protein